MAKSTLFIKYLFALYSIIELCSASSSNLQVFDLLINEDYKLHFHTGSKDVGIHIVARTSGFVGFGISATANGQMHGSDMFIGGSYANGSAYGADYHGVSNSVVRDASQDWHLVSSKDNGTHTEIEIHRNFITCDTKVDLDIKEGEMTIIWSLGLSDDVISGGHGSSRGSVNITIVSKITSTTTCSSSAPTLAITTLSSLLLGIMILVASTKAL